MAMSEQDDQREQQASHDAGAMPVEQNERSPASMETEAAAEDPASAASPAPVVRSPPAPLAQPQSEAAAALEQSAEVDIESGQARRLRSESADAEVLAVSRQHTRRSFLGAAAAVAAGVGFYSYVNLAPDEAMQPLPLEGAYRFNAAASRTLLPQHALTPTYPLNKAETLRVNGVYGLKQDLIATSWRLQLVGMKDAAHDSRYVPDVTAWDYKYMAPAANADKGHDTKVDPSKKAGAISAASASEPPPASGQCPPDRPADNERNGGMGAPRGTMPKMTVSQKPEAPAAEDESGGDDNHTGRKPRGMEEAGESDSTLPPHTPGLLLQMADITRLPRVELVTQFKCIEGWSQIVHWAGVRMADFLELYPPAHIDGKEPRYVYMETPDGDYYTGYDLVSLRHPQALLVTEMMGAPLSQSHGAPLRLHMPTRYGYKQIKRIGLIAYTNTRPDDYWTKLGYDWYAGL